MTVVPAGTQLPDGPTRRRRKPVSLRAGGPGGRASGNLAGPDAPINRATFRDFRGYLPPGVGQQGGNKPGGKPRPMQNLGQSGPMAVAGVGQQGGGRAPGNRAGPDAPINRDWSRWKGPGQQLADVQGNMPQGGNTDPDWSRQHWIPNDQQGGNMPMPNAPGAQSPQDEVSGQMAIPGGQQSPQQVPGEMTAPGGQKPPQQVPGEMTAPGGQKPPQQAPAQQEAPRQRPRRPVSLPGGEVQIGQNIYQRGVTGGGVPQPIRRVGEPAEPVAPNPATPTPEGPVAEPGRPTKPARRPGRLPPGRVPPGQPQPQPAEPAPPAPEPPPSPDAQSPFQQQVAQMRADRRAAGKDWQSQVAQMRADRRAAGKDWQSQVAQMRADRNAGGGAQPAGPGELPPSEFPPAKPAVEDPNFGHDRPVRPGGGYGGDPWGGGGYGGGGPWDGGGYGGGGYGGYGGYGGGGPWGGGGYGGGGYGGYGGGGPWGGGGQPPAPEAPPLQGGVNPAEVTSGQTVDINGRPIGPQPGQSQVETPPSQPAPGTNMPMQPYPGQAGQAPGQLQPGMTPWGGQGFNRSDPYGMMTGQVNWNPNSDAPRLPPGATPTMPLGDSGQDMPPGAQQLPPWMQQPRRRF